MQSINYFFNYSIMQTVLIISCLNVPFNFHLLFLLLVHHQVMFERKKYILWCLWYLLLLYDLSHFHT